MREKNKRIKNSELFNRKYKILGLPVSFFVFIIGMVIITITTLFIYLPFYLSIPLSVIFTFTAYLPAYIIHTDDPVGYKTWIAVLLSPESFHCEFYKKKEVKIINLDSRYVSYLTIYQFFKYSKLN